MCWSCRTSEAAHIACNVLKVLGGGITIGPILVGTARSAHVVTQSITVRGLVNMSALACVRARDRSRGSTARAAG